MRGPKIRGGRVNFLSTLITTHLGAGAIAVALYLGAQYHCQINTIEHNLLRRHMEYTQYSHRGSLGIVDIENNQGKLEKKLKNMETGEFVYTLRPDCLPDNDSIYQGLQNRIASSDYKGAKEMAEDLKKLQLALRHKRYGDRND